MAHDKQDSKKQKYKVGQVLAIPLPDKRFAYGKVFNDLDVGVYDLLSDDIKPVEQVVKHKILFYSAVTSSAVKNGDFLVIGEQKFPDEESAWAPPMVMGINPEDHSDGFLHIAHKGDVRGASPEQATGLDIRVFSQRPDLFVRLIVDRLVEKNNLKYRYAP
ncbi:Imm26 family immunity protein [Nitrosospira briensis]|uniref:Imm26 family immunity protein n=1 Tax=Nitrosospira briensis TaxID=35799 RepID=UPI0008ECA596|nr:Imm26 family immunity protein [Nitrosospira briensis]SFO42533.1 Immunity protein 26 [Nitrosospira briensis]